jgi:FMN reductase
MSNILAISGSPSPTSRTARVLNMLAAQVAADHGHDVHVLAVRELPAAALMGAEVDHPAIALALTRIAAADGLIVATPVYKAAYSGLLKTLLDLLPQFALAGKVVLPLATGGSPAHVLAIDYALRPVLSSMGPAHIVQGYFLLDRLIGQSGTADTVVEESARAALDGVLSTFLAALDSRRPTLPSLLPRSPGA